MSRLLYPLLLAAMLAALAAGCGGDDDGEQAATDDAGTATFDEPGFDITFDYPGSLRVLDDIRFNEQAGSSAIATAGVGLDSENLLALQRFDLNVAVTKENVRDVRPEADALFSELAGEDVEGRRLKVGGMPALQYEITLDEPPDGQTRATAIFDRKTQYLLNCQSTPEEREAIQAACDTALATLARKKKPKRAQEDQPPGQEEQQPGQQDQGQELEQE